MKKRAFLVWISIVALIPLLASCGAAPQGTNISVSDVGNVEGTVTDASTGTALSGVTVQIGDKTATTGDNGVYSIQDLDVGTRPVTASKTEYQNHNGTCEVSKGTTVTHDIQLTANTSSDTTPSTVSSTSPANNAPDIAINGAITVTFSEAMDVSTITTSTFTLEQGTTPVSGTVTYSGTTATFTPSSNLSYSTSYTATIATGAKDTAGNAMASDYSWSFTTGLAPDTTPPTVSSTSPANNAIGVTVNSAITATFSENMDASTITTSTFTLKQGTTAVSGTVTYNGTTATFTPSSNLSYSTTYTATVTAGVKDAAGNAMSSDYSWSFTTGAVPDTTPPTVSSTSPASNVTSVTVNSAITATFSENMEASTITTSTFTLKQGSTPVFGTVTYNGTTATFTPSSNIDYSTSYTATITTDVKDAAGNALASNYSWSFTTGAAPDITPPTVSSTSPASDATGVAVNSAITATFSENMDAATITTSIYTLKQGTTSVSGTVTYSGTTATFTPSANLDYSITYTATITTGAKDSAGNAMGSGYTWSFTTGAAPALLDTSFGTGGKVTSDFGGSDYAYALAIQANGKIIAAGTTSGGNEFVLAQYNTGGSLDATFGTSGKVTQANLDYAQAVLVQSDGKIVAAGRAGWGYSVARFNQNGSLDSSFSTDGIVKTDIDHDYPSAAAIQSDGKIVVVGSSGLGNLDFAVIRYNSNGTLDSTFGTNGTVVTPVGSFDDWARAVAIQSDGKIVVSGYYSSNGSDFDFCVVRYDLNGSLDATFGSGGKVTTNLDNQSSDVSWGMTIQPDGKIILVGSSKYNFAVARYNGDGSLDATFGNNGIVVTTFGSIASAYSVTIQTDGKIVVAGKTIIGSFYDFAIVRYNTDGSIDSSFGGGKVTTAIGSFADEAYAVILAPDGKIVVAGSSYNGTNSDFAIVRYMP